MAGGAVRHYMYRSTHTTVEAKALIDNLRQLLQEGGFDLWQWASNVPAVIKYLPPEAKSERCELWLSKGSNNMQESTLGLRWNCLIDSLDFKLRLADHLEPTLRNIYKALASQYDPLGFIIPFTTRAKVLIQDIWKQDIEWDDRIEPQSLREQWAAWVNELPDLIHLEFPRTSMCRQAYCIQRASRLLRCVRENVWFSGLPTHSR